MCIPLPGRWGMEEISERGFHSSRFRRSQTGVTADSAFNGGKRLVCG
jgi:hypothetical protein